jgi:hypothetical protein
MKRDDILAMLARAQHLLGAEIVDRVLLVGGCVPSQYELGPVDAPGTTDVDVVFEAQKYSDWTVIENELIRRGLSRPVEDATLARFAREDLLIDVATTPYVSVGYNRWYDAGLRTRVRSPNGWWVPSPTLFLAMKFEAYASPEREGHGDPFRSKDIEGVFTVLRGAAGLLASLSTDTSHAARFVRQELLKLARRRDALDIVQAQVEPDAGAQATAGPLLDAIRKLERAASPGGEGW